MSAGSGAPPLRWANARAASVYQAIWSRAIQP
jgi:hypothetical protein